jgi:DNA replication protein DnaC
MGTVIEAAQVKLERERERQQSQHEATKTLTRPIENSDEETVRDIIRRAREKSKDIEFGEEVTEAESAERKMRAMGIPAKYRGATFETFHGNAKLVETVRGMAGSVILKGNTGCGKTHLAIAWLKEKGAGRIISVPKLLLDLREAIGGNSRQSEGQIIAEYARTPFLVLDDLGAEKSTEYSITSLYLVIDQRVNEEKPTVITTNILDMAEIETKLSARIASRLAEMESIKINMPDYRKRR